MSSMNSATPSEVRTRLHRFGMARDRLRGAMAGVVGIGLTDLDALECLEVFGPLTQRDLGTRLLLTSGAVTQLVDRLERLALVRRAQHPTDRRATVVELMSDSSLPEVPELDRYHQALKKGIQALPTQARGALADLLAHLETEADSAAALMRARTLTARRRGATEPG